MILMYHHIAPAAAANAVSIAAWQAQMAHVKEAGYPVLALDDYVRKAALGGLGRWDVAITFDDAYRSFAAHALPVLQDLGFPATVFMPVDFAGKNNAWDDGTYPIMDWAELRAVSQAAGVTIGSHGRSHRRLRTLDQPTLREEVHSSKVELENRLGLPVRHFAYPYGQLRDFDRRCRAALVENGYTSGCATVWSRRNGPADLYALHRLEITPADDLPAFAAKLSRSVHPRYFRQSIKNLLFQLHLRR
jgi:peptidoglycan/xylan/chitin deacetylase (PgdA/CDA1 family)